MMPRPWLGYAYVKEQRARFVSLGLCGCGGKLSDGYKTCERCRIGNAERNRRHRAKGKR
jgi:hypothetical protein